MVKVELDVPDAIPFTVYLLWQAFPEHVLLTSHLLAEVVACQAAWKQPLMSQSQRCQWHKYKLTSLKVILMTYILDFWSVWLMFVIGIQIKQCVIAEIFLLSEVLGFLSIKSCGSVRSDWRREYSPADDRNWATRLPSWIKMNL